LVRYGEIILKGLNRHVFEEKLAANIRRALSQLGRSRIDIAQGRIFIIPGDETYDLQAAALKVKNVFGVVSASIAYKTGKSREEIAKAAEAAARGYMGANAPRSPGGKYTFKNETKRSDKSYARISPEISRDAGYDLLSVIENLEVDVVSPQFTVFIEVRETAAYAYTEKTAGFGGLPIGSNGKALLLLSGGIDSPVAGFMMAKRGVEMEAVHFYSYPYTNERSRDKVIKLSEILAGYFGRLAINIVPFTDVQLAIRDNCREELSTIVMRRAMMYIAEIIAGNATAQAIVTGESMGQVASQTIQSLAVTDCATALPVFRPLIGMDKLEVIGYARRIGTYDTSILPYDDCCTLFTPKHPKTKPKLDEVLAQEARVSGLAGMVREAADNAERLIVYPDAAANEYAGG